MKYYCNPVNLDYKYQFIDIFGNYVINREAADPSLILFQNEYYLFTSMSGGFFVSTDLVEWVFYPLKVVQIHDYAPDVCVIGEYMYFSASRKGRTCPIYRCKYPKTDIFEEVSNTFVFWDPNLFKDDDGRIYFYWGCDNKVPIRGVELNPKDMTQKGEIKELFFNQLDRCGYERNGENHFLDTKRNDWDETDPYIEGAWMTKHNNKYYLQYAAPGTQYNVYMDGVYEADYPLGPFKLARNNPFSYKPGGFIPGAGHGSTLEDKEGNFWHTSTMRISMNHIFERRLGLWPAGFDTEGELFCNQRYGDWVMPMPEGKVDPWAEPEWMLLSKAKIVSASSFCEGYSPEKAVEENVRTWWKASTNQPGEWLMIDLGEVMDVRALQINFADDNVKARIPEDATFGGGVNIDGNNEIMKRHIDLQPHATRWILEGSEDGKHFIVLEDKSEAETDLCHDLVVKEQGVSVRFIRLTVKELPFQAQAAVSGLRVFGKGNGKTPKKVENVRAFHTGELDVHAQWEYTDAIGYNVLWGHQYEKLYHSHMVFDMEQLDIKAIIKGENYYLRIDAFNENGITIGDVIKVES